MGSEDHLGTYAEGWTQGNSARILEAVDDAFVFDDPNAGRISKSDFGSYFSKLKERVDSVRVGTPDDPFMELTEVVTHAEGDVLTAWCWWVIPGAGIQGSGLIKVGEGGVLSERIAYYAPLSG